MSEERKKEPISLGAVARYTLVVLAIIVSALFFWQIKEALLAAFGGVIIAVFLCGTAREIRKFVPLSRAWSLVTVGLSIIFVSGLFVWLFGSQVVAQFEDLTEKLPDQISELEQTIRDWPLGEQLIDGAGGQSEGGDQSENQGSTDGQEKSGQSEEGQRWGGDASGMIFKAGSTAVDVLSTLVIILFIGIFFSADPDLYKRGITLLVTKKRADRVQEALETSGHALWQWLKGQLVAMVSVGALVTIGLLIIGVPLAFILGFLAGLLDFVPYIGPIVAVIPAILLAFSVSPQAALLTALLFLLVQQIEGNMITPLVQKEMVSLPPALVILSVVAFGLVFGIPGVVLATPLAVIVMVLVNMLYIRDVLGKEVTIPGQED